MITSVHQKIVMLNKALDHLIKTRSLLNDVDLGEQFEHLEANADDGIYSAQGYIDTIIWRLKDQL